MSNKPKIILGSTSPFRRELLQRLQLDFDTAAPDVDESAHDGESAEQLVIRLAEAKARAVGAAHPGALIIGSDQVAVCDGNILGKPGDFERAVAQLQQTSGKAVCFLTGLCLLDTRDNSAQLAVEPFTVHFRKLSDAQIAAYLKREQPYNCAGSFKSEGLGITLFERLEGDDPNTLIGLPLIRLVDMLMQAGIDVLTNS